MNTTFAPAIAADLLEPVLEKIATEHLDLETLATRGRDSLDFHDLAVWEIRRALAAAYEAGAASRGRRAA